MPDGAYFDPKLGEFLLPYDVVRQSADPEVALTTFLESTYHRACSRRSSLQGNQLRVNDEPSPARASYVAGGADSMLETILLLLVVGRPPPRQIGPRASEIRT